MSRVEPETSNRRLARVSYLGENDRALFDDLRARCDSLRTADEQIPVVDANSMDAWSRQYAIYQTLKRRRNVEEVEATKTAVSTGALELRWTEFVATRGQVLEYLAVQHVDAETREYVGLTADLLADPIIRGEEGERFGYPRRRDWESLADGLSSAWYKLRTLSAVQRAQIPDILERRRLAAAVKEISERQSIVEEKVVEYLNTLEQKLDWHDARISSVESRFSNKH